MKINELLTELESCSRIDQDDKFGVICPSYQIGFKLDQVDVVRLFHENGSWQFTRPDEQTVTTALDFASEHGVKTPYCYSYRYHPIIKPITGFEEAVWLRYNKVCNGELVRAQINPISPGFPRHLHERRQPIDIVEEHENRIKQYKTSIILHTSGVSNQDFDDGRKVIIDIAKNIIMKKKVPAVFPILGKAYSADLSNIVYFDV